MVIQFTLYFVEQLQMAYMPFSSVLCAIVHIDIEFNSVLETCEKHFH